MKFLDSVMEKCSACVSALLVFMTIVSFVIVFLRYFLGIGFVWMQDLVIYAHAACFLLMSASTMKSDQHVRVDIFYRGFSPSTQRWINVAGSILFVLPFCGLLAWVSIPYVRDSWEVWEGSKDGGGLEGVFLLKSLILVFVIFVAIQTLLLLIQSFQSRENSTSEG